MGFEGDYVRLAVNTSALIYNPNFPLCAVLLDRTRVFAPEASVCLVRRVLIYVMTNWKFSR